MKLGKLRALNDEVNKSINRLVNNYLLDNIYARYRFMDDTWSIFRAPTLDLPGNEHISSFVSELNDK